MRIVTAWLLAVAVSACGGSHAVATGTGLLDQGPSPGESVPYIAPQSVHGALVGRISNERVPRYDLSHASLSVYDRYPLGSSATTRTDARFTLTADGRFSIDAAPGEYWIGARLHGYRALLGPVVVTEAGGSQDLVLAPDFISADVVTRRGPSGAELMMVNVMPVHPANGELLQRANVTLINGPDRWHVPYVPTPGGGGYYHLQFGAGAPLVYGGEFILAVRSSEINDQVEYRTVTLRELSAGTVLEPTHSRPNPELAPSVLDEVGYEVRWRTPADASFSTLCVLADEGTFVVTGGGSAVTSPHRVDISRLTPNQAYELEITVGRAAAVDGMNVFNVDTIRSPFVIAR